MKIQINNFATPQETINGINELLKPHGLWICTTEEQEDDEPECCAYEILQRVEEIKEENDLYLNHYECECGEAWTDVWSCACNDKCPSCNKEIEPYVSKTKCQSCEGSGYVGASGHEQLCDNCNGEGYEHN